MTAPILKLATCGALGIAAILAATFRRRWFRKSGSAQVDALKREASDLRSLLETDDLTVAHSRRYLADRVDRSVRTKDHFLAVLDLDDFKGVNDAYGHSVGDRLLKHIAEGLVNLCRPGDFVTRLGGDEFCIYFQGDDAAIAHKLAERMRETVGNSAIVAKGAVVSRSASMGLTRLTPDQRLVDALNLADVALYEAKSDGRNQVRIADQSVWEMIRQRRQRPTVEELSGALERGEVRYHVQPIFELATSKPVGVEALIRWEKPDGSLLLPDAFLDIMTDNYHRNMRPPIEFANQVGQLFTGNDKPIYCTWNISTRFLEMQTDKSSNWLDKLLHDLDPKHTVFEIVENAIIRDVAATRRLLHALREAGVRVALDDFGTGYSNLERLLTLPVDIVKLDRSFVRNLGKDMRTMGVVDGLISISDALGFEIVAEGIEHQSQLDMLAWLGVRYGQGFMLGKPKPAAVWKENFDRAAAPQDIR